MSVSHELYGFLGVVHRCLGYCIVEQIAIVAYYCMDLEAVIVDFLRGLIANIGYSAKDFDAIIANRLAKRNGKAVNNQKLSSCIYFLIPSLTNAVNQGQRHSCPAIEARMRQADEKTTESSLRFASNFCLPNKQCQNRAVGKLDLIDVSTMLQFVGSIKLIQGTTDCIQSRKTNLVNGEKND